MKPKTTNIIIICILAFIFSCIFVHYHAPPGTSSEEIEEGCEHATYQKTYEFYNNYDHLIRYTCDDCDCIFYSGNCEHAFWDIKNSCASITCNYCGYTCEHSEFNGIQCSACHFVCEHEFQNNIATFTGSACLKCGQYCCTHENVKWIGVGISVVCLDCGMIK